MKRFMLTLTLFALVMMSGCSSSRSRNHDTAEQARPAAPSQESAAPSPVKDLKTVSGTIDTLWINKGLTHFTLAYPIEHGSLASDGWYVFPTFAGKTETVAGAARGDEVNIKYSVDEDGTNIVNTLTVTMKWTYHEKE